MVCAHFSLFRNSVFSIVCPVKGVPTNRRFKVLVNPAGGKVNCTPPSHPSLVNLNSSRKGRAKKIFDARVKPIFEAAKSVLDVQCTPNSHNFYFITSNLTSYTSHKLRTIDSMPKRLLPP